MVKNVLINQTLYSIPTLMIVGLVVQYRNTFDELPTLTEAIFQWISLVIFQEIGFYYCHRLLHTSLLFKYHKTHHEWERPIALVGSYCHPVEHIINNILANLFGM